MGLTIHYSGKLKSAAQLTELIEEVKDIANTNEWKYFIFEDKFPNNSFSQEIDKKNLYVVMVTPPGSEPVCFSFFE
jgi:hypothetical protein